MEEMKWSSSGFVHLRLPKSEKIIVISIAPTLALLQIIAKMLKEKTLRTPSTSIITSLPSPLCMAVAASWHYHTLEGDMLGYI
jgi:hypothetical protein